MSRVGNPFSGAPGAWVAKTRREERFDAVASGATSNAVFAPNRLAPIGFGRRRAIFFVAAPQRCSGIAYVAAPRIWPYGAPNDAKAISDSGH